MHPSQEGEPVFMLHVVKDVQNIVVMFSVIEAITNMDKFIESFPKRFV